MTTRTSFKRDALSIISYLSTGRIFGLIVTGTLLVYILASISPALLFSDDARSRVVSTQQYGDNFSSFRTLVNEGRLGESERKEHVLDLNALLRVRYSFYVRSVYDQGEPTGEVRADFNGAAYAFRSERLVVAIGFTILVGAISIFFRRADDTAAVEVAGEIGGISEEDMSARRVLASIVQQTNQRANELYSRSTLLLVGGIVMAFVGVAIFSVTTSEEIRRIEFGPDESQFSDLFSPSFVRSTGILLFVEAIAWFLLRQYRVLIEDFKSINNSFLKRANYLAAYNILRKDDVRDKDLLIATALMNEDLTGRLSADETTESLEARKLEGDANPVFDLVKSMMLARTSTTPRRRNRVKKSDTSGV